MVSLISGRRPGHQVAGGLDWVGTTAQRNKGLLCRWHEKRTELSPNLIVILTKLRNMKL